MIHIVLPIFGIMPFFAMHIFLFQPCLFAEEARRGETGSNSIVFRDRPWLCPLLALVWRSSLASTTINESGKHFLGLFISINECGHGVGEAEAGVGGRGMACHVRPCGEAAEDRGG